MNCALHVCEMNVYSCWLFSGYVHAAWEVFANPLVWLVTGRTLEHVFVELVATDGSRFLTQFGSGGWELYECKSHEDVLTDGQGDHGEPWLSQSQALDLSMGQVVDICDAWRHEYGIFTNCRDYAQYLLERCYVVSRLSLERPASVAPQGVRDGVPPRVDDETRAATAQPMVECVSTMEWSAPNPRLGPHHVSMLAHHTLIPPGF